MAADTRGAELEQATAQKFSAADWMRWCGHVPERMDPVHRLLWWRHSEPSVMALTTQFLGWHEFLTLRLSGRAVTDPSLAGRWLAYDLSSGRWSSERLAQFDIDPRLLPEIQPWGTGISTLRPDLAAELNLSPSLIVAVGAFDACCATVGSGASEVGVSGLICGSWEDIIAPVAELPPVAELSQTGLSIGPHPGRAGLAIFALSPNGTAVVDWARRLTGLTIAELEGSLEGSSLGPSPVLAVPHLSGSTTPWPNGRDFRGGIAGLTLATSGVDVVKALMEGITFDMAITLASMRRAGMKAHLLRAAGGGANSAWWTQLKADLYGIPVEVVNQPESGTVGAALLAGLAIGAFPSLERGAEVFVSAERRYEPDFRRASLYTERIEAYKAAVAALPRAEQL